MIQKWQFLQAQNTMNPKWQFIQAQNAMIQKWQFLQAQNTMIQKWHFIQAQNTMNQKWQFLQAHKNAMFQKWHFIQAHKLTQLWMQSKQAAYKVLIKPAINSSRNQTANNVGLNHNYYIYNAQHYFSRFTQAESRV